MKKRYSLFVILIVLFNIQLSAQVFQVRVAAFTENIESSFFTYAGYPEIYTEKDANNFTRYILGEFSTIEAALKAHKVAIQKGFNNAYIHILKQPIYAYASNISEVPARRYAEEEALFIRSIQFVTENFSFNNNQIKSLEETLTILRKNLDLKLRIVMPREEMEENQSISNKRARMVQNFLLANDIPAFRLKIIASDKSNSTVNSKEEEMSNDRIIMALVDLKGEIVKDNFIKTRLLYSSIRSGEFMRFIKLT